MPSLSIVVFGPAAGAGDGSAAGGGPAAGDGEATGDGAGDGDGEGSGSAPARPAEAAHPASISPAVANRAATGALNPIAVERTGAGAPFHTIGPRNRARQGSGQPANLAGVAERVLVSIQVVPRDLRVHRTFQEKTQHRIVSVIGLVEGQHRGAVRLLVELVVALGARPQRRADRHVTRQFVELGLGDGLPRSCSTAGQQVLGHFEYAGADQSLAGLVALVEDFHAAGGPFEHPGALRARRRRRGEDPPAFSWGRLDE